MRCWSASRLRPRRKASSSPSPLRCISSNNRRFGNFQRCRTTPARSTRSRRTSFACSATRRACGSSSCCATGERSVGALQDELGLDSGGTSQHLAALRRIGLVESRREGTSVYYRVADARVFDLLEAGRGDHRTPARRAAVDPARARDARDRRSCSSPGWARSRSAALLAARAGARSRPGSGCRRPGAPCVGVAGFWALATGDAVGAGFTSVVRPAPRRRRR